MNTSLYTISAPIFVQFLTSMSGVLEKTAAHAEAKKIDPAFLMNMRLYPGVELPNFPGNETTFAELQARIAQAIAFIKTVKPEQVNGKEDADIVLKFPSGERQFKGHAYLVGFALPNFYFHMSTAYGILRHCGVEIGKRDFIGTPVTL